MLRVLGAVEPLLLRGVKDSPADFIAKKKQNVNNLVKVSLNKLKFFFLNQFCFLSKIG